MNDRRLNVAVVGIGGFGHAHHLALRELEQTGRIRVVAACDPAVSRLGEALAKHAFIARGVGVYHDMDTMLREHAGTIDIVDIVSPIRHHAEQHLACVKQGLACYLEKPPTLDPAELRLMLANEAAARIPTQVGFNHIGQDWRIALKGRIISGEFGPLRRVCFVGLWRRSLAYYERNNWAGRLLLDGRPLLDSCCGNAMAHHVHNLLFHAGSSGLMAWASPHRVEAELYRVNAIESADTIFARGQLENGVEFRLAASHACDEFLEHEEILECEHAYISIPAEGPAIARYADGRRELIPTGDSSSVGMLRVNLTRYADCVLGRRPRPDTRLADTRPFVELNALLFLAAGRIQQIRAPHTLRSLVEDDTRESIRIPGLGAIMRKFAQDGRLPSERGLPWSAPGGGLYATEADLDALPEILAAIAGASPVSGTEHSTTVLDSVSG